jgi:hypothetical protein
MHLDRRKVGQDIWRLFQLDPVKLNVLPRGEMPIPAIVFAGDMRKHPELSG